VPVEVDQIYTQHQPAHPGARAERAEQERGTVPNWSRPVRPTWTANGGQHWHAMITAVRRAVQDAWATTRGNLFATIVNLQRFTLDAEGQTTGPGAAGRAATRRRVPASWPSDRQGPGGARWHELSIAPRPGAGLHLRQPGADQDQTSPSWQRSPRSSSTRRASLSEALNAVPLAADNVVNAYDATKPHPGRAGATLNELSMGAGRQRPDPRSRRAATGAGSSGPAGAVAAVPPSALRAVPAAATAGCGLVRHTRGCAGGRPLMRFRLPYTKPRSCPAPRGAPRIPALARRGDRRPDRGYASRGCMFGGVQRDLQHPAARRRRPGPASLPGDRGVQQRGRNLVPQSSVKVNDVFGRPG